MLGIMYIFCHYDKQFIHNYLIFNFSEIIGVGPETTPHYFMLTKGHRNLHPESKVGFPGADTQVSIFFICTANLYKSMILA